MLRSLGLLAGLMVSPLAAGEAIFLGSTTWPAEAHGYGGFSGLELSQDGRRFTAISDRGAIVRGTLSRQNNRITSITSAPVARLLDREGHVQSQTGGDSEGLALGPAGEVFVSFEGNNRVWSYQNGAPHPLPRPDVFRALQGNSGLEALAIDAQGRLYTLPERSGQLDRPFPVWRFDGRWQQVFDISRSDGFLPVGADFGPDGHLYVLERLFSGFGFRSRVRRVLMTKGAKTAEETLFTTRLRQHDNLEGLSVWRDSQGRIRLTMISDDNFRRLQKTEFVEYALP